MVNFRTITGNDAEFRELFWPTVEALGHTFTTLLVQDDVLGERWSLRNMTDPDEYNVSFVPTFMIFADFGFRITWMMEHILSLPLPKR
jgi:hypothetical protein